MNKTALAAALLGCVFASAASAQTTTPPSAAAGGTSSPAMNAPAAASPAMPGSAWRSSKLVGVNVYNNANEKIGAVQDLIVGRDGRVATVVIGVGGFLGMGEHNVGVPFGQVQWSQTAAASNTGAKTTTGAATGTSGTTANWYPDHGVYNATKDQLKAMPEFKY